MKRADSMLLLIALCVLSAGCAKQSEEKIENIVRVLQHRPYEYTLYTQTPDSVKLERKTFLYIGKVEEFTDVPRDQPMWARVSLTESFWQGTQILRLELHLHSVKNIEGGGWDSGKLGSGTTHVIR